MSGDPAWLPPLSLGVGAHGAQQQYSGCNDICSAAESGLFSFCVDFRTRTYL